MKQKSAAFFLFVIFSIHQTVSSASAPDNGKILHDEHCQSCHLPEIYNKADRMVKNPVELKERVKQCELMNELLWFEEDVDDVTSYLNQHYYLFGIK